MKTLIISATMLLVPVLASAQATQIATSGTLPANCTVGDVYVKTGASAGLYSCLTTDTWTAAGGGGGGSIGGSIAASQVAYGSGADTIAGSSGLLYDATNKALTMGAASGSSAASFWTGYPFVFVEEQAGDLTPGFVSYAYSTIANAAGGNFPMRSRGTPASPTAVLSGDKLGVAVEPAAYTGSAWGYSGTLYMEAGENWSGTATGSRFVMKVTPNGENQTASKSYSFDPASLTIPGSLVSPTTATFGAASGTTGAVLFKGTTSGTVTLSTADAAGTWTMKLPTTGGTSGYFLQTDGSGNTTWATGYKSADGSAGVTVTTCTSFKDGLCVAGT